MSWNFDTTHSEIAFTVRHMVFAKVRGSFTKWSGGVQTDDSGALVGLSAEVQIDSIDTREPQRDGHLKSPDFFDAAAHPTMSFASTGISGDTNGAFSITGDLTIRGTTRPVTLQAKATGAGKDPWGNQRRGFRASATINRKDFGLTWNQALELGGVLVGEEVEIEAEVQLVKQG